MSLIDIGFRLRHTHFIDVFKVTEADKITWGESRKRRKKWPALTTAICKG